MKDLLNEADFVAYWKDTVLFLETKKIENFEEDNALINKLITSKQYLVSHSSIYALKYNPAYRIINKEFLKKYDEVIKDKYFMY